MTSAPTTMPFSTTSTTPTTSTPRAPPTANSVTNILRFVIFLTPTSVVLASGDKFKNNKKFSS
jgi:hypothetical protein